MRIKDFERAINALCVSDLVIDEFKLKANSGGHVRQANGHTNSLKVIWDENGRCYSASATNSAEEFIDVENGQVVTGRMLNRDSKFDLKFE